MSKPSLMCLSVAAAVALPLCVHAQEFTPTSDRIVSDPTFLPLKGQIYGQSNYVYDRTTGGSFDGAGDRTSFNRSSSDTYSQTLAYGVTDRLSLNIGIDYQTDRSRNSFAPGEAIGRDFSGFSNPTFGAAYRLIDQRDHPFNLDVRASYSPDAIAARIATADADGSTAFGGQQADFSLALGHQTRAFTIQGIVSGRYLGDRTVETQGGDTAGRTSSYWIPELAIGTQTRLTRRLSVNVDANYDFDGSPTVAGAPVGEPGSLVIRQDRGNFGGLKVAANYHFIPNTVVGSLNYSHTFFGDTHNIDVADSRFDSQIHRSSNQFGATLRYVFK